MIPEPRLTRPLFFLTGITQMSARFHNSVTTGKDQKAKTPASLFDAFGKLYGISREAWFDVCPENPDGFDGLQHAWQTPAFCNPPFQELTSWFDKAVREWVQNGVFTLILIPFRSATRYMHHHILQKRAVAAVVVLTDSVRFEPYKKDFPLPIVLISVGAPQLARVHSNTMLATPHYRVDTTLLTFVAARVTMQKDVVGTLRKIYPFDDDEVAGGEGRRRIVRLNANPTNCVRDIVARISTDADANATEYVMVIMAALFNGTAFKLLLPYARHIYLISPQVSLGEDAIDKKSFLGTVAVLLQPPGAAPLPEPVHTSVPGYVTFHRLATTSGANASSQLAFVSQRCL